MLGQINRSCMSRLVVLGQINTQTVVVCPRLVVLGPINTQTV